MNLLAKNKTLAPQRVFVCAGWRPEFVQTGTSCARSSAFTMIEIALCIAVVSFALVAILGVLPTGHQVQRDNREDTIVNQDGAFLLEAIRNGLKGTSDLSNYVDSVTIRRANGQRQFYNANSLTSAEVIGLLTTPKYDPNSKVAVSNTVSAVLFALSGSALNTPPPLPNAKYTDRELAFKYQVTSEVIPATPAPTNGLSRADLLQKLALRDNLHELRLTFRWPVLPSKPGDVSIRTGNSRRIFSTLVSGQLEVRSNKVDRFYYFQPSVYQ